MTLTLDILLSGLVLGGMYALIALGLTLQYGIARIMNLSYGEFLVAAAFGVKFAYWDNGHLDLPFKWADFAASVQMPCCFATTVADGRMLYAEVMAPRLRLPSLLPLLAAAPFIVRPEVLAKVQAYESPPRRLPWWRRLFRWH